jgi:tRNA(Ile)-lysidine synthetase-like protein
MLLTVPGTTPFGDYEIEVMVHDREEIDTARLKGDKGPSVEYLDLDRVQLPLIVRTRRPGDRFQPLGLAGEKKVGKFLTTAKVPRDQREHILIVADHADVPAARSVLLARRMVADQVCIPAAIANFRAAVAPIEMVQPANLAATPCPTRRLAAAVHVARDATITRGKTAPAAIAPANVRATASKLLVAHFGNAASIAAAPARNTR